MWFIKLSQTIPSDLIYQAYKLCSTGEDGFDLSYECLTSKRAKDALAKQVAASSEFAKSLQQPEIVGEEDDDELDEDNSDVVVYDETDSSRTINEEVEALILQKPGDPIMDQLGSDLDDGDVHAVGTHGEVYRT